MFLCKHNCAASLESLEAADVDSMSSSARSNINDDGAAGSSGIPATDSQLQLELSLSGSDEGEDLLDDFALEEDDDYFDRVTGDVIGDTLESADGLTESELTLRAASTNSAMNVRDDRYTATPSLPSGKQSAPVPVMTVTSTSVEEEVAGVAGRNHTGSSSKLFLCF